MTSKAIKLVIFGSISALLVLGAVMIGVLLLSGK